MIYNTVAIGSLTRPTQWTGVLYYTSFMTSCLLPYSALERKSDKRCWVGHVCAVRQNAGIPSGVILSVKFTELKYFVNADTFISHSMFQVSLCNQLYSYLVIRLNVLPWSMPVTDLQNHPVYRTL